jgi:hypothetical protein
VNISRIYSFWELLKTHCLTCVGRYPIFSVTDTSRNIRPLRGYVTTQGRQFLRFLLIQQLNMVNKPPLLPRRREPNSGRYEKNRIGSPPSRGRGILKVTFSLYLIAVSIGVLFWELLKTLKSVRGELVEPHLSQQNQPLTKSPFDKLRANGGFLEVAFYQSARWASTFSYLCLKMPVNKRLFNTEPA